VVVQGSDTALAEVRFFLKAGYISLIVKFLIVSQKTEGQNLHVSYWISLVAK
jgi:hypothetical protein